MNTTGIIPYKTPEGLDELARRTRRLGQRHRTVLLLVDGRRSVDQVLALALAAGVAEHHYRDVLDAGLIALPEGAIAAPTQPVPLDEPSLAAQVQAEVEAGGHLELPVEETSPGAEPGAGVAASPSDPSQAAPRSTQVAMTGAAAPVGVPAAAAGALSAPFEPPDLAAPSPFTARPGYAAPPGFTAPPAFAASAATAEPPTLVALAVASVPPAPSAADVAGTAHNPLEAAESQLPAMRSLLPDSQFDDPLMPATIDGPLEEAREILMRAVRTEAPVAGRLTLLRLKNAGSRSDLDALLDEVEQRIARPRRMVEAAQTLRHVRHLLCMPPSTAFTLY